MTRACGRLGMLASRGSMLLVANLAGLMPDAGRRAAAEEEAGRACNG